MLLPAPMQAGRSGASSEVDLHAFVNWDYDRRQPLRGWRASAMAISGCLAAWHPKEVRSQIVVNGDPSRLSRFLRELPAQEDCEMSVVYLASHQSRDTDWHFTQGTSAAWRSLLDGVQVPRHTRRLIILDACFSAGVREDPSWRDKLSGLWMFASSASEETFEVNVRRRQPVDLRRRYPEATQWLEANLDAGWDGRISFTGFVWTCAFLATAEPPRSTEAWTRFLSRCEEIAAELNALGVRRFASEISHAKAP